MEKVPQWRYQPKLMEKTVKLIIERGLGLATQTQVLFLNPDCILDAGSLKRMVEVLASGANIGMVGGLLTNLDGSEQGSGRRAVPTPWRSLVRAFGLTRLSGRWPKLFCDFHLHAQPLPEAPIEVEAVSGALWLASARVWFRFGLVSAYQSARLVLSHLGGRRG